MKHFRRLLVVTVFLISLFVGCLAIKGYINYSYIVNDIGLEETINHIMLKDDYVEADQIPHTLLEAFVSTEDKRFYRHNGIDMISIGRAILIDIRYLEYRTGGSTITQQLAKNLFLSFDKTLERKATEYFLAKKIERMYSKDEILALYVNVINYGDGCFGISSASKHYFNKEPMALTDSEAVLLSGLPQSPVNLSLSKYYDNAVVRSEVVINSMINNKVLKEKDAKLIIAEIKKGLYHE
ncbi:biosynthetic peptidoglycan transglycosylase [Acidaminobacter sp. JC074]|uniref:biosynthetic peptidoglycan transglycosylase n=1 Tax=Acidaminobacter sp. JC074 TaxID=2530199 RepID=UPI001F0D87EB|nr:biosynthetic peptidoglycan transglycosylase [Acidaminobacter sp. JC074]